MGNLTRYEVMRRVEEDVRNSVSAQQIAAGNKGSGENKGNRDNYDSAVRSNYSARAAADSAKNKITEQEFNRSAAMQTSYGSYQNYLQGRKVTAGGFYSKPTATPETIRAMNDTDTWIQSINKNRETYRLAELGYRRGDQPELAMEIMQKAQEEYDQLYKKYQEADAKSKPLYEAFMKDEEQWRQTIRTKDVVAADVERLNQMKSALEDRQKQLEGMAGQMLVASRQTAGSFAQAKQMQAEAEAIGKQIDEVKEQLALVGEEQGWEFYYRYEKYKADPDFALKSQYTSEPTGERIPTTEEQMMAGNPKTPKLWKSISYEMINGNQDAIGIIRTVLDYDYTGDELGKHLQGSEDGRQVALGMTDEERAKFNYLYHARGAEAAAEYFYELEAIALNTRFRVKKEEETRAFTQKYPVAANIYSVAVSNLMKPVTFLNQVLDYADDGKMVKDAPYNKHSYIQSAIRDETSKNWHPVGQFAYQTGMSLADFAYTAMITGSFSKSGTAASKEFAKNMSLAIMGTGTAADTTLAAKDRGLSDGQAMTLGTIAGMAEILTEKFSIDTVLDELWSDKGIAYLAKNIGAESSEEMASDLINLVADVVVSRDQSEWRMAIEAGKAQGLTEQEAFTQAFMNEAISIGLSGLGGGISGGVMGGGYMAYSKGVENSLYNKGLKEVGKTLITEEGRPALLETVQEGLKEDKSSPAYKQAQAINAKIEKGKEISALEAGKLFTTVDAAVEARLREQAENGTENAAENAQPSDPATGNATENARPAETVTAGTPTKVSGDYVAVKYTPREVTRGMTEQEATGARWGVHEETVKRVGDVSRLLGVNVVWYRKGAQDGLIEDGYYNRETGKIYLNADTPNPTMQVISHELTHALERTRSYGDFYRLILGEMTDLDTQVQEKIATYARAEKSLDEIGAKREIVAHYVQTTLLTDEKAIRSIVRKNTGFGRWMINGINNILAKLGNKQAKEKLKLRRASDLYAKALREFQKESKYLEGTDGRLTLQKAEYTAEDAENARRDLDEAFERGEITEEELATAMDEIDSMREESEGHAAALAERTKRKQHSVSEDGRLRLPKVQMGKTDGSGWPTKDELLEIQGIGYKSVSEFSSRDIQTTERYARRYWKELGIKSPFFRAWFGDWRINDHTPIEIATLRDNAKGQVQNNDTGWNINVSRIVFTETSVHTDSYNTEAVPYLPFINDIVKKAVLLDSYGFKKDKIKSVNSLLMHSMYAVADKGDGPVILKLYVEEMNDPNNIDTAKRAYQLQNVEKYQPTARSSRKKVSSLSAVADVKTIADLFRAVKMFDKNLRYKKASAVVKKDGTPLLMYHGTPAENGDFTVFDANKAVKKGGLGLRAMGKGNYFTSKKLTGHERYGSRVIEAYLNIKKPFVYYTGGDSLAKQFEMRMGVRTSRMNSDELQNTMRLYGFDGVIQYGEDGEIGIAVTFDSSQIKSATDNVGTFDRENNDILYSVSSIEDGKLHLPMVVPVEETARDTASGETDGGLRLPKVQYSFSGVGAEGADLEALQLAQQMEQRGAEMEEIRMATGWHRGIDGEWRYEIDDSNMQYHRGGDAAFKRNHPEYARYQELQRRFLTGDFSASELDELRELDEIWGREFGRLKERVDRGNAVLEDILDHPALFDAYPKLRSVKVAFADLGNGERGRFNAKENKITLDLSLRNAPQRTLIHEIQHAIQNEEGFAGGGSQEYWESILIDGDLPEIMSSRSADDLYRNTAGEIEARNAAERSGMSAEDRRSTAPEYGNADTVFSRKDALQLPMAESTRDKLPAKAESYVARAERELVGTIGRAMSVPNSAQRQYLRDIVREISEEYLSAGTVTKETADRLFETAYEKGVVQDAEFYNQYKYIKDHLRETKLTISEQDKADIADYDIWRKRAFGTLRIVNEGGLPVDSAYAELREMAPELFPIGITHPADQLQHMYETAKSIAVVEKNLNDYYGPEAETFKAWAKNDFDAAVMEIEQRLWDARRYMDDRNKEQPEVSVPMDVDEAIALGERQKQAWRDYNRVASKHLLTDNDQIQVGRLMRGEILPEHLTQDDNIKGILAVYEARKVYEEVSKPWARWRQVQRAKKDNLAAEVITPENIQFMKDKKAGMLYARETMQRNNEDIMPPEVARKVNAIFFDTIRKSEKKANEFKTAARERVKKMNLSRKVEKGNLVSEAHAVQLYGEARANIEILENSNGRMNRREGRTLQDWKDIEARLWLENPNLDRGKIEQAVKEFREIYDKLLELMNRVRVENGYEPVSYRKGYFPHFQPGGDGIMAQFAAAMGITMDVTALPTTINGLTYTFNPGITWFGNTMERLGFATAYDAVEGFDKYIEGVSNVIFFTENIQMLRALERRIRYLCSDEGVQKQVDEIRKSDRNEKEKETLIEEALEKGQYRLSNYTNNLHEYTNLLAGKKSELDRGIESMIGRRWYNLAKAWEKRIGANMVGGNIGSALTNLIPLQQAGAQLPAGTIMKAMLETMKNMKDSDGLAARSAFISNRKGSDPIVKSLVENLSGWAGKPMEFIDSFVAETIVRAKYGRNIKAGMSEEAAMDDADAWAARIMAERSKGGTPTLFASTNPIVKLFTQFQLEVNNEFSLLFKDIPRANREKGLKALAAVLLRYIFGAWVFNEFYEFFVGRRPALDPLNIINETVGDFSGYEIPNLVRTGLDFLIDGEKPDFTTQKKSTWESTMNLVTNAAGELPFSSALALVSDNVDGGRIPAASGIPNIVSIGSALADKDMAGRKKWNTVQKELDKLAYVLPPFGGGQLAKMIKGTKALIQGGSYSVNKDGEDILQYPVYRDSVGETILNVGQMALFGKSATREAQKWVDSGFQSLSAKETAVYQDLTENGMKERDAFEFIQSLQEVKGTAKNRRNGAVTTNEAKRRAVIESDVSEDAKVIAFYGLLADEEERTVLDGLDRRGYDGVACASAMLNASVAETKEDKLDAMGQWDLEPEAYIAVADKVGLLTSDNQIETMKALAESGQDMQQSAELLMEIVGAEKRADKLALIRDADLDREAFEEYAAFIIGSKERETETGNRTQFAKLMDAVDGGLDQRTAVQMQIDGHDLEKVISLMEAGMKPTTAANVIRDVGELEPEDGYDDVQAAQKWRACVDAASDPEDQIEALRVIMNESQFEKVESAYNDYGIAPEAFVRLKERLPEFDEDGNGSFKQSEVTAAMAVLFPVNVLPGGGSLSNEQKAALWQLWTGSKSAKNNPYSRAVGQQVIDTRNAAKEAEEAEEEEEKDYRLRLPR